MTFVERLAKCSRDGSYWLRPLRLGQALGWYLGEKAYKLDLLQISPDDLWSILLLSPPRLKTDGLQELCPRAAIAN